MICRKGQLLKAGDSAKPQIANCREPAAPNTTHLPYRMAKGAEREGGGGKGDGKEGREREGVREKRGAQPFPADPIMANGIIPWQTAPSYAQKPPRASNLPVGQV